MHLYVVRGLRVICLDHELRHGRIRIVYEQTPNQRYMCPPSFVGSVRVHRQVSASNSTTLEMKCCFSVPDACVTGRGRDK